MRISLRRLAVASVLSLFATATCVDSPTGPRAIGRATFGITPVFSKQATRAKAMYAAAGLELDHVRLLITRPPAEVVKDTIVVYNGTGDLPVELSILGPVGELLTVKLEYLSDGVVLYSGTTQVTTVSPLTKPSDVPQAVLVIDAVGPGFDATSVTVTPSSGTFLTNAAIPFTAKAFKASGEISGAVFEWSVNDETVGTVDGNGTLTPTTKGGPIKVRATALSEVFAEATITLKSPPTALTLVSGGGQTANAGATLTQVVVKVADANGNGVEGETVTFAVASGGGSIVVNNGITDASGLARVTWTLGGTIGSQSITATRAGLTGSPITVTATATGPTKLGFVAQPSNVAAGVSISPAVQVAAQDANGNTVTGFTGTITVAIGTNPGGATLGGTLSVNAVAGVATFSTLSLNNAGTGYTLTAAATGLTNATSNAFNVVPAAAAAISLSSGGGQTAATGATLTQIVVKVADANGNGVAGEAVTFAVATGGGSIVVDNGTTDASGLARVTWTLGTSVGSQSITATRAGLTGSPLTITATATTGAASKLGFTVQPSTVIAGAAISPAVQVAAQDANGATVTSFTGTITIAIGTNPGSATLGGTVSASAVAGVATFNNLKLSAAGNGYTLGATATGLTAATSNAFNVTAGTPAALEFVVQPSNVVQNAQISPPVQVRVVNAFGVTVASATNIVTVALSANPGSATLGGNPNSAAVAGIASFSTLTLDNVANGYTLSATATGLTGATSTAFNVVAPAVATRTWTGAFSTSWGDVSNWSPGGTPTVSDSVVIPSGTAFAPTLSSTASVRAVVVQSGAVLSISAVSLTVSPGALTNQGTLNLTASTLSGALDNQSTVLVRGGVTVAGTTTNASGGTLTIQGTSSPGAAAFAGVLGITNAGTIDLTDQISAVGATLSGISTITNTSTGTITVSQGVGGQRVISGALNNQGTITISSNQGLILATSSAASSNGGTITLSGGNFSITHTGTAPSFTNTGTISVGTGRTMTVNGGSLTLTSGSVTGASGTLSLLGVTLDMTTAAMTVPLTTNAATTIVGGTLTIPSGQELTLLNAAFSSQIVLQGTLTARRNTSITGTFANAAGSVLRAMGTGGFSGNLTIASGFTNNGTIQLTDSVSANGANLTVTSGALVNAASAQVQPLAGAGGSRTLTAALDNQGALTIGVTQGLTIDAANAVHTNSGSISLTTGNLTIAQSGSPASFTNTGTISVPSGRTLTMSGGSAVLGDGLVTGTGTVSLTNVAATFTARTSFPFLTTNAGTTLNGGSLTVGASDELKLLNATVSSSITLNGTLTARRNTTITGTFSNTAGSLLRAFGTGGFTGDLTIAAGFVNNGTIQLTDSVSANGASLSVNTGTLINTASAQIQPLAGAGGSRTLTAALDNQGALTIGIAQGLTINGSNAAHSNSGSISLTTGNLTITQSGSPASFTNTGTISVPSGRTLSVSGGSFVMGDGLVTGIGTVTLTGVAATFVPRTSFPFLTTNGATSLNGGTLTVGAGEELDLLNATVSSSIVLNGTLTARRNTTITGTFTNAAGSLLRAFGTGGFTGDLTIASGFANNGTIQLTDSASANGASLTVTSGTLVNPSAGLIQPLTGAGGSRTLTAALDNQGTLVIGLAQGLTINGSNAAHSNTGSIALTTGDLTITQSGSPASFTNTGTISVPSGRTLSVSGGAFAMGDGLVTGIGTVTLTGVAATFVPRTSFPYLTTNAATSLNGGALTVGAGEELDLLNATVSSSITLNGTLTARRNTSITGTFANASGSLLRAFGTGGFTGDLTIGAGFVNNGTIQLTDSASANGASLTINTGTLVNTASAQIQPLAGAGGSRTLTAALNNQGTLTIGIAQGLTINGSNAAHSNSGSISLTTGNLTITQSGSPASFTNTGTISVPSGRTLSVSGGSFAMGDGLVTGAGTVTLTGVAGTFVPRTTFPFLTTTAATSLNGGSLTVGAGEELKLLNATVSSSVTLNGTLTARRNTSITTFANAAGSVLRAFGTGGFTGDLTITNGFTNNGTIQLTDSASANGASLTVSTGTLVNSASAQIQPLAGAGGSRTLTATLNNQGTLTIGISQGLTINGTNAAHTNSGSITLTSGNLTITQSGSPASFTNTGAGTISIPSAQTLFISGGSASLGINKVFGPGTLNLASVAVSFDPRSNFPVITSNAATSFNGGTLTIPDTVDMTFVQSTISSNVALAGTLTGRRTTNITGTFTNTAGSVLRAMGTGGFAGNLGITNGFTNNGTIQLTDSASANGATFTVVSGTLVNAASAQIQPLAGAGGSRTLTAALNNQGTLTIGVTQGLTIDASNAVHTNSGSINLTTGDLTITQGGSPASFTTTGTISVPSGRTLSVSGGSFAMGDGLVTGIGTVTLTGVAATFVPRTSFPYLTTNAATSLNGGALTVGAGEELDLLNATVSSGITLNGTLTARRNTSITGTFANASGSLLRAFGTGGFAGNLTIASGFTNNGTIQLTDSASANGASLTVSSGTLVNPAAGSFQPLTGAGGSRTLTAALNNQGTITLSNTQGLNITGAVTNQSGATLSVNSAVPMNITGQFSNAGTFNIAGNQTVNISSTGAAHTNSGSISMPSITSGTLFLGTGGAQTFSNTGTISLGSGRAITLSGTAFTNASGGTLSGSGSVGVSGSGSFTNNGTVAPGGTGATGTLTFSTPFNQGATGVLQLEAASTVSYDRLTASSTTATFGGTLNFSFILGYSPGSATHDLMTFTSQTGTFATINKPSICTSPTVVAGTPQIYRTTCTGP